MQMQKSSKEIFRLQHSAPKYYNIQYFDGYFLTAEVNTLNKTKISLHGCTLQVLVLLFLLLIEMSFSQVKCFSAASKASQSSLTLPS
jgi:hypothetical protein